ncbi:AMP-binding protein, partial [Porphyromonas gingivalis]|uniref:AMP-binding protein n=1 Tax=Porphyromonas gingivalis TaxID=837 RepID=UPI00117F2BD1
ENYPVPENREIDETLKYEFKESVEKLDYPLSITITEKGEIVKCSITYASEIFKLLAIKEIKNSIKITLASIIENPFCLSSKLNTLNASSYNMIVKKWNNTYSIYPKDKTIIQMFEEQVKRTPQNKAVIYENTFLTYAELNKMANKFGNYLKELIDIKKDDLIVICLDRSQNMLITILAILKSGAAYVPIGTDYPEERIKYVIKDTRSKALITEKRFENKLRKLTNVTSLICVDCVEEWSQCSDANLNVERDVNSLAYVIYTSGTTGNPKGVMIENRSVVNRIVWMNNEYPLHKNDRILQKTPYTFDVSVWELFWANWYGACIVFAKPDGHKDSVYLAETIRKEQITVIHFVPSMLSAFEDTLSLDITLQNQCKSLHYIFCSGEALTLKQVKKCHELLEKSEIHNLYGPTEATVDVLYYNCNDKEIMNVLIGRPIANTSAYVLDKYLNPLPVGAIGELY